MQRIGILRGGVSPEYHLSLKTGANVQRALADAGFEAIDMLLDKEGVLHIKGIPADMETAGKGVDKVWNALHGDFGEDGRLQTMLDEHHIAYVGSGSDASALAFDKARAKEYVRSLGIKTPQSVLIMPDGSESIAEVTARIYRTMAPPWVLKPLTGGSSVRTYFAFTRLELAEFVDESVTHAQPFLVEQYIYGREAAIGVINGFRNQEDYVLPVVEIKAPSAGILSHDMRSSDEPYAVSGGGFRADEREKLSTLAKDLHHAFGAKDYSQSEFIVDAKGTIWFIEMDTQPSLQDNAPFLVALDAVGSTLKEFVASLLQNK